MSLSVVGTPVELNESSSTTSRTMTVPTLAAGDALLLFLGVATGSVTFTVTDNGLSHSLAAVASAATQSGHTSGVYQATNLGTGDSAKIITIVTSTSLKVAAALVVVRGGNSTAIIDTYANKTASSTSAPSTPTLVTTAPGTSAFYFVAQSRGGVTPNITTLTADGSVTKDADAYTSGTASLSSIFVGHDFTSLSTGDTIGAETITSDVSALYSAWTLSIKPGNLSPIVSAGSDTETPVGVAVPLTGSATDPDGTISTKVWSCTASPAGSTATISASTSFSTNVTPDLPGEYTMRLRVTDNSGAVTDDFLTIWATTTTAHIASISSPGGWLVHGAADIPTALADSSDSTWAESGDDPTADTIVGRIDPMPAGAKVFTYRIQMAAASPTGTYVLTLKQGATTISTKTHTGVTDTIVAGTWTLTTLENAAITDRFHMDLYVAASV